MSSRHGPREGFHPEASNTGSMIATPRRITIFSCSSMIFIPSIWSRGGSGIGVEVGVAVIVEVGEGEMVFVGRAVNVGDCVAIIGAD